MLNYSRYLLQPKFGSNVPRVQPDDDAAEGSTYKTSGVKASYGSRPSRNDENAKPETGQAVQPSAEENVPPSESADQRPLESEYTSVGANGQTNGHAEPRKSKKDFWKDKKNKKKETGQNKERKFGSWGDKIKLCSSAQFSNEFSPQECKHGAKCKYEHNLRKYLEQGKMAPLKSEYIQTCPVYQEHGFCPVGWQCRFVDTHSKEVEHEDGRKELVLLQDEEKMKAAGFDEHTKAVNAKVYNIIDTKGRIDLERRRMNFERSDKYAQWLVNAWNPRQNKVNNIRKEAMASPAKKSAEEPAEKSAEEPSEKPIDEPAGEPMETEAEPPAEKPAEESEKPVPADAMSTDNEEGGVKLSPTAPEFKPQDKPQSEPMEDVRSTYKEPPFRPSEKRRLYFGPETPVLAPLTTQGNLPFRRLCIDLGAQVTWGEMAMGLPLIQGQKAEWALVKAHESEFAPPTIRPGTNVVQDYDNSRDMKFGVQIAANKPALAFKATEALAKYTPRIRAIDFNCGCPIDMVFNSGGGSALLDMQAKLEKILRGMNALSDEIPIQVKVRMGVKDNEPTAAKLAERLILGGESARNDGLGPCGIAAMTLHGRSRQQRYTKLANWEYISAVSAMIKDLHKKQDAVADTVREADPRDQANGGRVYFIGNGDVYSAQEYHDHIRDAGVDSIMVARGALIKPWVFEEIQTGQALDKSSSERLGYIEKFCKYGLDTWGSDEMGVGTTRRFLLEWLSFTHRYIPLGLLERPAKINERPSPYKGRDDMETLLASDDYRDWIKIRYFELALNCDRMLMMNSEMFLGPSHKDFRFTPKHKSNAYDKDAETQG